MDHQQEPLFSLNEPAPYLSYSIAELDERLAAEILEERVEMACVLECNVYCFLP